MPSNENCTLAQFPSWGAANAKPLPFEMGELLRSVMESRHGDWDIVPSGQLRALVANGVCGDPYEKIGALGDIMLNYCFPRALRCLCIRKWLDGNW